MLILAFTMVEALQVEAVAERLGERLMATVRLTGLDCMSGVAKRK